MSPPAAPNDPADPQPPTNRRTRRWVVALVAIVAAAMIAAGAVPAIWGGSSATTYRVRYEALGRGTAHLFHSTPDRDVEDRLVRLPATIEVTFHNKPRDARAIVFTVSETDTTRDASCRVTINDAHVSEASMTIDGFAVCGATWSDFAPLTRASDTSAARAPAVRPPRTDPTTNGPDNAPRPGVYVNGPAGTPHYYIALTTQPDGELAGTVGFLFQNGQSTNLFHFAGRPQSGVLVLTTAPDGGDFSVTYGPDELRLGRCHDYLQYVQTLGECTFTYSPDGVTGR